MSLRGGPKILSGSHPSSLLTVQIYQTFLLAVSTADKKLNQVINTKSRSLQPSKKKQQVQTSWSVQSVLYTAGYQLKTFWRQIEQMLFSLVGSSRRTLVRCGRWLTNLELKYVLHIKQSGHLVAEVIQHSESEVLNKLNKLQVKRCFLAKIKCYGLQCCTGRVGSKLQKDIRLLSEESRKTYILSNYFSD